MNTIIDYLKQLDLSDAEAKLYLTLIQTGPNNVRDLAQTVNIKRTTAYFYIDQLIEKGLIMKIIRGSKKLISANDPENLHYLVEKKLDSARIVKQNLPTILEDLKATLPEDKEIDNAEIRYYKGLPGIRKIYEDAFKAKELRSYVKVETNGGLFTDNVDLFNQALKTNKNLTVKEIIYDSPDATIDAQKILQKNERYTYKLMPKKLNLTSGDTLIYDGKVAIIDYKGHMHGVILHNTDYFNNSKELFDFIWKGI